MKKIAIAMVALALLSVNAFSQPILSENFDFSFSMVEKSNGGIIDFSTTTNQQIPCPCLSKMVNSSNSHGEAMLLQISASVAAKEFLIINIILFNTDNRGIPFLHNS